MNNAELHNFAVNTLGLTRSGNRYHCPLCDAKKEHRANLVVLEDKFYCQRCKENWYPDQLAELLNIPYESDYKKRIKTRKKVRDSEPASQVISDLTSVAGSGALTSKAGSKKKITSETGLESSEQSRKASKAEIEFLLERSFLIDDSQTELLSELWHWRALTSEAIKKCKLRFFPKSKTFNLPEKFKNWWLDRTSQGWILIPYFDANNEITFIKARSLTKHKGKNIRRWYSTKGNVDFPYNYHSLDKTKEIFICEGESDCISAISLGFNACGCSGADFKQSWLSLFADKNVTVCFDIDDAGINGANKAIKKLKQVCKSLRRFNLSKVENFEGKDFNDYVLSLLPVDDNTGVILPEALLDCWLNADESQRKVILERICIQQTEGF